MASLLEALAKAACTSARKAKSYTDEKISKVNENFAASAGMVNGLKGYSMRGTESGQEITIDDMRDLPSKVRVKATLGTDQGSIVNLIPYDPQNGYYDGFKNEDKGITFEVDKSDGSITATGTATGNALFYIANSPSSLGSFDKYKTYKIRTGKINGVELYTNQYRNGVNYSTLWISRTDGASGRLANDAIGYEIYILVPKGTTLQGVKFEPMIVEDNDTDITNYVPPYGIGATSLNVAISTASADDPSIEGETISANIGETIEFEPIFPAMKITSNRDDVTLRATYNRKIDKVIEKITDAFIRLGGKV